MNERPISSIVGDFWTKREWREHNERQRKKNFVVRLRFWHSSSNLRDFPGEKNVDSSNFLFAPFFRDIFMILHLLGFLIGWDTFPTEKRTWKTLPRKQLSCRSCPLFVILHATFVRRVAALWPPVMMATVKEKAQSTKKEEEEEVKKQTTNRRTWVARGLTSTEPLENFQLLGWDVPLEIMQMSC